PLLTVTPTSVDRTRGSHSSSASTSLWITESVWSSVVRVMMFPFLGKLLDPPGKISCSAIDIPTWGASAMDELNVGVVPVCDGERLVGMVTDRDIAVRGVAHDCSATSTRLNEVMTKDPLWCFDDEPLEQAMEKMRDAQVRRLPVVDHDRHLV